jgi:hypothetical protein
MSTSTAALLEVLVADRRPLSRDQPWPSIRCERLPWRRLDSSTCGWRGSSSTAEHDNAARAIERLRRERGLNWAQRDKTIGAGIGIIATNLSGTQPSDILKENPLTNPYLTRESQGAFCRRGGCRDRRLKAYVRPTTLENHACRRRSVNYFTQAARSGSEALPPGARETAAQST